MGAVLLPFNFCGLMKLLQLQRHLGTFCQNQEPSKLNVLNTVEGVGKRFCSDRFVVYTKQEGRGAI